VHNKADWFIF